MTSMKKTPLINLGSAIWSAWRHVAELREHRACYLVRRRLPDGPADCS